MIKQLSADVRRVVLDDAVDEARRRHDNYVGTEHLLLALLHEPGGDAAAALGIDLRQARDQLDALDGRALASVGVSAASPEPSRIERTDRPGGRRRLTNGSRQALRGAVAEATRRHQSRITSRDLLVGLLAGQPPDAAVSLLRHCGCDVDACRDALVADDGPI